MGSGSLDLALQANNEDRSCIHIMSTEKSGACNGNGLFDSGHFYCQWFTCPSGDSVT